MRLATARSAKCTPRERACRVSKSGFSAGTVPMRHSVCVATS